jgi:DHA2 family lincomycin resistance protein-like MFS transporter
MTNDTAAPKTDNTAVADAEGIASAGAHALAARNRMALILLLAAVFVVFLNETMMTVALPKIQEALRIDATQGQWLTTAFALTMAVVIPTTGWLLQRLNTRPVFITAMVTFSIGTLIAALSPVFEMLIVGRVVQAIGTAIMMPLMMTTVMTIVAPQDRGRIMGRISIVMAVAPAVGPTVSGALLQFLPWQGLFWVMLPIALVMLAIGARFVPNVSETRKAPLDVLSVVLSAVGFSSLVYGLSSIGSSAVGTVPVAPWVPILGGVVVLGAFVWRQIILQRTDSALLDLRTFLSRNFTFSITLLAVAMLAMFGVIILIPQFARYTLGLDTLWVGAILLPGSLLMGLLGPLIGRLYDKYGPRPLIIPGSLAVSGALWLFALTLGEGSSWLILLGGFILLSLGLGFLFTPLFSVSLGSLEPKLYSYGSATVATLQQVAGAAGIALFVALYATGLAASGNLDPEHPSAAEAAAGAHIAFIAGGFISLAVVALTFFIRKLDIPATPEGEWAAAESH